MMVGSAGICDNPVSPVGLFSWFCLTATTGAMLFLLGV